MKNAVKRGLLLLCAVLLICLAGCGPLHESDFADYGQDVQSRLATACVLSADELYFRAAQELQSARMHVYSSTTITQAVVQNFMEAYPELAGKVIWHDMGDESQYPVLIQDIAEETSDADLLISHSDLALELTQSGDAYNFFPMSCADTVDEDYRLPTAFMYSSTLFMYNKSRGAIQIDNVWALTDREWRGRILMKDPRDEQVNMDFLLMLTSPQWTVRLESAYRDYYGTDWTPGDYETIAEAWIAGFLANCDFSAESNSDIIRKLADTDARKIALVGYSKLRKLDAGERAEIGVFALGQEIDGFSGFAFGTYATVVHHTDCPYACALFIRYLLSEEGFSGEGAWNNYVGYYSTNTSVAKENVTDDYGLDFWRGKLVFEDSNYIGNQTEAAERFILRCLEK